MNVLFSMLQMKETIPDSKKKRKREDLDDTTLDLDDTTLDLDDTTLDLDDTTTEREPNVQLVSLTFQTILTNIQNLTLSPMTESVGPISHLHKTIIQSDLKLGLQFPFFP